MARRESAAAAVPAEKKKLNRENLNKLYGIFRFMLPYKVSFIVGLVCLFVSTGLLLIFPKLTGSMVGQATGSASDSPLMGFSVNELAFLMMGLLAVQGVISFARIYFFAIVSEKSIADLREALYQKLISLPMAFYDRRRIGELMSRISNDVALLQETFSTTLAEFIRQLLILFLGTAALFFYNASLTLFMLLVIPVIMVGGVVFGTFIRRIARSRQDSLAETNTTVEETLQSVTVVKSFANEAFEVKRYGERLGDVVQIGMKTAIYRGLFASFIIFAIFGGIVAVVWRGGVMIEEGSIKIDQLLEFLLMTVFIAGSIAGLGNIYGTVQKSIGASERVLDILSEASELPVGEAVPDLSIDGEITFENVSFRYPTRQDVLVLDDVSFRIAAGEKVALVGHSGAGKSTVIQLLLRLYDLDGGRICIDGRNADQLDLTAYRSHIGMVPQEVILFGGTIRENIAYGKPNASEAEIVKAAKQANAYEFIERFPEGFDTVVGERGVKLSGGQRQRVAIARAILKDPAILVLDEATSSLDAESERLVQEALETLMQGRTTIVIAHRLATIRKVDRIYVLDQGKLVEEGTHEALAEKEGGVYANLLRLQFDWAEQQ